MGFDAEACWPLKGPLFSPLNSLRPRQNRRHFADDIFKRVFLNENILISIDISLKFVRKDPIDHIPALVQIMAWRRSGDKPLSEPMMVRLPTHICVTRPQWVNPLYSLLGIGVTGPPLSTNWSGRVLQAISSVMVSFFYVIKKSPHNM